MFYIKLFSIMMIVFVLNMLIKASQTQKFYSQQQFFSEISSITFKKNNVSISTKHRAVSILMDDIYRQKLKKKVYQSQKIIKQ
jgi:hypothetical protein